MVAQRSVELYACIQKWLVGLIKFTLKIFRAVTSVDIVAQHDDKIEFYLLPVHFHESGYFVMLMLSCAAVADYCKPGRFLLQRQAQVKLGGNRGTLSIGLNHPGRK